MSFNWICPYCQHRQTVVDEKFHHIVDRISVGKTKYANPSYELLAIGCANHECGEVTVSFGFGQGQKIGFRDAKVKHLKYNQFLPDNTAKPQPKYIPAPIIEDYTEACRIKDLSPKASATLVRRCLQGIIRDFCGISKSRLVDEIAALREAVDSGSALQGVTADSVDAIDAVRRIGNIGAHMEKDINIIIDVDPDEAQILIELVEMLFEEWYVNRFNRQQRLERIKKTAAAKDHQKRPEKLKAVESAPAQLAPENKGG